MVTKAEAVADARIDGDFSRVRNSLTDIQDAIRYMSLGHQFKDFLSKNLSEALSVLWDIQHPESR